MWRDVVVVLPFAQLLVSSNPFSILHILLHVVLDIPCRCGYSVLEYVLIYHHVSPHFVLSANLGAVLT